MKTLTVRLTEAELEKLRKLADARSMSVESCIQAFARACQPDGGKRPWYEPADQRGW